MFPLTYKQSVWDSIHPTPPKVRSILVRFMCDHKNYPAVEVIRTDRRPGPGWMSDCYKESRCWTCGQTLTSEKIY